MSVVLPAPFGPIRPTSSPSRTSRVTLTQRVHAAERDGQAGDAQHGGAACASRLAPGAARWRARNRRRRVSGARGRARPLVHPPVEVAGHALRVLLQGEDQQHAAERAGTSSR